MAKRSGSSAHDARAVQKGSRTGRVNFSDIPAASNEQLRTMRRVGRPRLGARTRQLIAIRLDPDVLVRLRSEARRRNVGYQTLVNRVLADYVRKHVA